MAFSFLLSFLIFPFWSFVVCGSLFFFLLRVGFGSFFFRGGAHGHAHGEAAR